ncbi:MAG: hypothetical protein ACLQBL_21330, partial [Polyangiaceae bacterium]
MRRRWIAGLVVVAAVSGACDAVLGIQQYPATGETDGGAPDGQGVTPVTEGGPDQSAPDTSAGGADQTAPEASNESGGELDQTAPDTGSDATIADAGFDSSFTPSNFTVSDLGSIVASATAVSVSSDCTADTDTGSWDCTGQSLASPPFTSFIPPGESGYLTVWALTSLAITSGGTLSVQGSIPGVFYVTGDVTIGGSVVVNAGALSANHGVGVDDGGVGGSGAGFCGAGGAGAVDPGGATYGAANLIPLLAGSLGGGGFGVGDGGAGGGGAIQISATSTLTVSGTGSVLAGGLGGASWNSGGGGSGGAILLEAPSVAIEGALSANGGGGACYGSNGQNATATSSAAPGGRLPDGGGAPGGNGSAAGVTSGHNNVSSCGGGGGAGWIRINTFGTPTVTGIVSPAASTSCYSL